MKTSEIKNGDWFTAYISGVKTHGRIRRIGRRVFFCQDIKDGQRCPEDKLFGYRYSWVIMYTEPFTEMAEVEDVKIFKTKPEKFTFLKRSVLKTKLAGYRTLIYPKKLIKVGCTVVPIDKAKAIIKAVGKENENAVTKYRHYRGNLIDGKTFKITGDKKVIVYKGAGLETVDGMFQHFVPANKIEMIAYQMGLSRKKPVTAK